MSYFPTEKVNSTLFFCAQRGNIMAKLIVGVNDLATVNPELAKEWDYEKNEKKPQDYTAGSGIKVWWLCEKGHSWQVAIYSRVSGRGCPICSNKQVCKGINDLATLKPNLAKEWNYDKNDTLTPSDVTISAI